VGRRALTIATERGDHALELEATYRIGQAYFAIGDYHQAIDLLWRSKRSAVERQDQGPPFRLFASWSHAWLAMAFSNLGRFVDAISHATEAVRIAERADHPFTLVEALTALGGVSLAKGDLDHAIGALERGLALSREWKFQPWATISRLGYAYALSAHLPDARRLLEEVARSETTVSSMGVGRSIQVAWLGEVYALDQQLDDALERAQEALALAQNHEEHGHEAWAHRLLGQIALRRRDLPDARAAEDHFRRALTIATELEMRPLMAHCHLGLGKFYRRTGQCEQAREYLSTAATMYREMDIGSWLEHAEAEMRQLG
jgi:tetratricopeptide (TPR) repeat protein